MYDAKILDETLKDETDSKYNLIVDRGYFNAARAEHVLYTKSSFAPIEPLILKEFDS